MKDLMNKVMEAKKAAEANLIARREETAAMRSQANTAKLLTDNPTLMRLRELEVLEKVATVLTDKDTIAREVEEQTRHRTGELGLEVVSAVVHDRRPAGRARWT